jgi:YesN/AraC family two-component response regulator
MRKFLHRIFDQLLTFKQKPDSPRSAILTAERKALIITQLHSLMEERQPYLIESYSLKNLADELQIRQHQLSVLLNRELGMNFNNTLTNTGLSIAKHSSMKVRSVN